MAKASSHRHTGVSLGGSGVGARQRGESRELVICIFSGLLYGAHVAQHMCDAVTIFIDWSTSEEVRVLYIHLESGSLRPGD